MKRAIALVLLMGLVVQAQTYVPSTVRITYAPGLSYEDGQPLIESDIEHYDLYCNSAWLREVPNDFTREFYVTVDDLGVGTHACTLSETVGGIESVSSDPLSFSLGQRTPTAPTLIAVQGA